MGRYLDAPEAVESLVAKVKADYFPELSACHVKVLMDNKKRVSKGRITIACIKKTNELERYFSSNNMLYEGYDFIMFIDANIYENLEDPDRLRIIRHELRHIYYDAEAKVPYKTIDHDITDFRKEMELNVDDPNWDLRVFEVAAAVYAKDE